MEASWKNTVLTLPRRATPREESPSASAQNKSDAAPSRSGDSAAESLEYWRGRAYELQARVTEMELQLKETQLAFERLRDDTLDASWRIASKGLPRPPPHITVSQHDRDSYGEDEETGEKTRRVAQVLLLGGERAGRTSLLVRLACDEFLPVEASGHEEEISPVFEFNQCAFQVIAPAMRAWPSLRHYTTPCALVYVFNVTDDTSFQELKDWCREWRPGAGTESGARPYELVVGTYADEAGEREVDATEAVQWAAHLGLPYLEVSCKTGYKCDAVLARILKQPHTRALSEHTRALSAHLPACPLLGEVLSIKKELVRARVISAMHHSTQTIIRLSRSAASAPVAEELEGEDGTEEGDVISNAEFAQWEERLLQELRAQDAADALTEATERLVLATEHDGYTSSDDDVHASVAGAEPAEEELTGAALGLSPLSLHPVARSPELQTPMPSTPLIPLSTDYAATAMGESMYGDPHDTATIEELTASLRTAQRHLREHDAHPMPRSAALPTTVLPASLAHNSPRSAAAVPSSPPSARESAIASATPSASPRSPRVQHVESVPQLIDPASGLVSADDWARALGASSPALAVSQSVVELPNGVCVPIIDKQEWHVLLAPAADAATAGLVSPRSQLTSSERARRRNEMLLRVGRRCRNLREAVVLQEQQGAAATQRTRAHALSAAPQAAARVFPVYAPDAAPAAASSLPGAPGKLAVQLPALSASSEANLTLKLDIEYDEQEHVAAASSERLVELLTNHAHGTTLDLHEFLLSYRMHLTLPRLLQLLEQRYNAAVPDTTVCSRVVNVLKTWVHEYFFDFASTSAYEELTRVVARLQRYDKASTDHLARLEQLCRVRQSEWRARAPVPRPVLPASTPSEHFALDVLAYAPLHIAQQLCLRDWRLFAQIPVDEFIRKVWLQDASKVGPTMIGMFTDVFNATSAWALMSVLLREKLKERVKVCKRLLLVADKLRALGNFHSLFAIVSALGLTPIARMRHTMDELIAQKKIAALQSELTAVTLFKGNYAAYRRELRAHAAPKVPYLGVITSDYTLAEEGNTDRTPDGLVNYAKCRLLANLLRNVRLMQQTRYAFHELPEILTPLENLPAPDEALQDALSAYLEPKPGAAPPRPAVLNLRYAALSASTTIKRDKTEREKEKLLKTPAREKDKDKVRFKEEPASTTASALRAHLAHPATPPARTQTIVLKDPTAPRPPTASFPPPPARVPSPQALPSQPLAPNRPRPPRPQQALPPLAPLDPYDGIRDIAPAGPLHSAPLAASPKGRATSVISSAPLPSSSVGVAALGSSASSGLSASGSFPVLPPSVADDADHHASRLAATVYIPNPNRKSSTGMGTGQPSGHQ